MTVKILSNAGNKKSADKVKYVVGIHCAPVLLGVKTANTISVYKTDLGLLLGIISETGLFALKLYECKEKCILFIYREDLIHRHLEKKDVRLFLTDYGYFSMMNTEKYLYKLVQKFQEYARKEREFPHELGVFLQYPIEDMKGFIRNSGKNYLSCGYWKVYQNEKYAKEAFENYDNAKKTVAYYLEQGCMLCDIVRSTYYNEVADNLYRSCL